MRRVHRVVRHVEVWSVAKVALLFALCGYVVALVSGFLLWQAADRVGTIEGIEGFFEDAGGYDSFEILGGVVFRSSAVILAVLAAFSVFTWVLGAVLFNLISDLTGGIRMTVIDEDLIVAPARRPRSATAPGATGPTPPVADGPPTGAADVPGRGGRPGDVGAVPAPSRREPAAEDDGGPVTGEVPRVASDAG